MRQLSIGFFISLAVVAVVVFFYPVPQAKAKTAVEIDAEANAALETFFSQAPAGKELAEKAKGILIFPSIIKAGLIVGGDYGEGALRINGQTVAYYSTASGSLGLQVGLQERSVVIMFMDDAILDKFRASDGWNVGVDGSIAIVRVGAGGAINTGTAKQAIIGFIFNQKGFMGNLTLEGTKLSKIVR